MSEEFNNLDKDKEQPEFEINNPSGEQTQNEENTSQSNILSVSGLFREWFLDYASYVILERAVPHVNDGLKPVQRRILHSMKLLDDGRYNKVANVIGYTMQFHPHGDASIGDALVQLGQKNLLIDAQGNWGNIYTGDSAAAPRYIEARLSKFASEVVFNPKTTLWKNSYDGRNKEPIYLPVKFPLLLAQGVEGIAVGLASKILPHNFNELIDASIAYLKNESFELFPDFPTGGLIDVSRYNDGLRGGRVRVRAKIDKIDRKTLNITEIPFSTTTTSLIESIINANDKGKIKIKKIEDKTSDRVNIFVHLTGEMSPDQSIDALYAFTDCEISISPNSTVIDNDRPAFLTVTEILKRSTDNTLTLLKQELDIRLSELNEDLFYSSLEKIFIENKIYLTIEECTTFEQIIETIDKHLTPFKKKFVREVTSEDIEKLTEIRIKRISKFDAFKADEHIKGVLEKIKETKTSLEHIVDYTIDYFVRLKDKFGKERQRKTEIRSFDDINITQVAVANKKLYVNFKDGFVGTELKDGEFLKDCSEFDDVIVFLKDGTYFVSNVTEKLYVGKDIMHIDIFHKNDKRTTYNVAYFDGGTGFSFVKRFNVTAIIKDRKYNITQGAKNSQILYFTVNLNGETETVIVKHKPRHRLKKLQFEYNFAELPVRNRDAKGNLLTKYSIHKITMLEKGQPTITTRSIWYDTSTFRIKEVEPENGIYLGEFEDDEKIIAVTKTGYYHLATTDLSNHFEPDTIFIDKFDPTQVFNVVYFNAEVESVYLKRLTFEETTLTPYFIPEDGKSYLIDFSDIENPMIKLIFKDKKREVKLFEADEFIKVKSYEAKGKRLTDYEIDKIEFMENEKEEQDIDFEVVFPEEEQIDDETDQNKEETDEDGNPILNLN